MQYISFCDIDIPLCFVSGFSFTKRAKSVEHAGGFESARGFDTSEMSIRILLSRELCVAFGLNFFEYYNILQSLSAEKEGSASVVYIGGYPIYPELNYAITNVNKTIVTDIADARPHSIELDISLSGVSCVKEVSRERALIFTDEYFSGLIPDVTIECNGKTLEIKDDSSVSLFNTTPQTVNISLNMSQDDYTVERKGFLSDLIEKGGTLKCGYPQGTVEYNIIQATIDDNELNLSGSVYSPKAYQSRVKTFDNADLKDIIRDICEYAEINANVQISGHIDHYIQTKNALESIIELQDSSGFIVSQQIDKIIFAFLPNSINDNIELDLIVEGDDKKETVGKVVWFDGLNEFESGKDEGEILRVKSCFNSPESKFCENVLKKARYDQSVLIAQGELNDKIWTHSQISILSNGERVPVMVDYFELDWVNGQMSLECKGV